jgi:hypothetical protein
LSYISDHVIILNFIINKKHSWGDTPHHLRFWWGAVDLNPKLKKILNGGNLTLQLLPWDHYNKTLNEGNPQIKEH